MFDNVLGVEPKSDEVIEIRSRPTLSGLVATWLFAPAFFLTYFVVYYLPVMIKNAISSAAKNAASSALGIKMPSLNFADELFGGLGGFGDFLSGAISAFTTLFIIIWIISCLIMTARHFGYSLAITNLRVIGNAKGTKLDSPLNEVMNVHIEQSIWGKIFKYGALTVRTKKQAVTFKNISNPEALKKILMSYAENYLAR